MNGIRQLVNGALAFMARYPAVIAGYIMYSYLFVSIIRLYLKVEAEGVTLAEAYDIFSALPFMWLLALALVKVIEIRTRLHESRMQLREEQERIRLRETQLQTMKEVVRGLQDTVNNPLGVIELAMAGIRHAAPGNNEVDRQVQQANRAMQRIVDALKEFSESREYDAVHVDAAIGNIAKPEKPRQSALP